MSPAGTHDAPSTDGLTKSLDRKLAEIRLRPNSRTFILADAKDADMAYGVRAPGPRWWLAGQGAHTAAYSPEVWSREEFGCRNLPEFLDIIRAIVRQGTVDIMLMSPYVNELLTIQEGLFRHSPVTPAARANIPRTSGLSAMGVTRANLRARFGAPPLTIFNAAGWNAIA
ncbi:MAG: hypothetical protein RMN51_11950 [Verrucomicrobiota bacterium]|nr:hypothetical protein [Limisphaera sp.]MDW8382803.1 hypothetical protein [Verrucomicrobiota bacterium]